VGFTGVTYRYFYLAPVQILSSDASASTFTVKQISPYAGVATGVAAGTITREADRVNDITESGVYFGLKLGADYLLSPRMGLRSELVVSSTIFASSNLPGTMSEFGLVSGLFLPF
jgi:hypothetical protein